MRVIKKYSNRKLYDTIESKFVNIKKVKELINNGENIKVLKHGTEDDVTTDVLLEILTRSSLNLTNNELITLINGVKNGNTTTL
jgi:polyhydroxyalkanoate synthesis repressor PhaR